MGDKTNLPIARGETKTVGRETHGRGVRHRRRKDWIEVEGMVVPGLARFTS